ncbi:MAG: hypothetical protein ACP59X_19670 [Solidesulfovibrio sp. DCME]|uniref:hypothetical protein n=1 Tax=Solidesulfovibrio sp. DCME TaxID=3447380 RepID=UPI003D0B2410
MDIATSYDSLTKLLSIQSSATANFNAADASGTSTVCDSADGGGADSATWSKVAKALSETDSDFVSPILKLKSQNEALQQQLTQTLASKFEALGIDTSQTITLSQQADGKVVVTNDHPDKEKIESLFADTDVLSQAFSALAQNSASLKSLTSQQVSSRVRTSGYAAYLTQLSQLSDSSSTGDFVMSLLGDASTTYFNG